MPQQKAMGKADRCQSVLNNLGLIQLKEKSIEHTVAIHLKKILYCMLINSFHTMNKTQTCNYICILEQISFPAPNLLTQGRHTKNSFHVVRAVKTTNHCL